MPNLYVKGLKLADHPIVIVHCLGFFPGCLPPDRLQPIRMSQYFASKAEKVAATFAQQQSETLVEF